MYTKIKESKKDHTSVHYIVQDVYVLVKKDERIFQKGNYSIRL